PNAVEGSGESDYRADDDEDGANEEELGEEQRLGALALVRLSARVAGNARCGPPVACTAKDQRPHHHRSGEEAEHKVRHECQLRPGTEQLLVVPLPRAPPSGFYSARTGLKPSATRFMAALGSVPACSARNSRLSVRICEALTTDGLGRPLSAGLKRAFPGASAGARGRC